MSRKLVAVILSLLFGTTTLLPSCSTISNPLSPSAATLGERGIYATIAPLGSPTGYGIYVDLKPTSQAVANTNYIVDLYENGKLRGSTSVSFNQPEINVQSEKKVIFPASADEYHAYFTKDIRRIFSIKMRELIIPGLTIITPNGGEHWYVGDIVTITWNSTNLAKDEPVEIRIQARDTSYLDIVKTTNTGNYKWKVIPDTTNANLPANHAFVMVYVGDGTTTHTAVKASKEFTIYKRK